MISEALHGQSCGYVGRELAVSYAYPADGHLVEVAERVGDIIAEAMC